MFFLSFDTVMDLHDHLTASVSDCEPTEDALTAALGDFARQRNLDPEVLIFNYRILGLVKSMAREAPELMEALAAHPDGWELAYIDPTEVN